MKSRLYVLALMFMIFITGLNSVLAIDDLLLHWRLNEGIGLVIFDYSGYNNNGILNRCRWNNNQILFDDYNLYMNDNRCYLSSSSVFEIPDIISFNIWFYPINNNYYIFSISDDTELLEAEYFYGELYLYYYQNNSQPAEYRININIPDYAWNMFSLTLDTNTSKLSLWLNGQTIVSNLTLSGGYHKEQGYKILKIGRGNLDNEYLIGYIEDVKLMSGALSNEDILSLYNYNNISYNKNNNIDNNSNLGIDNVNLVSIISSDLENITNISDLELISTFNLKHLSDCNIYINKEFYSYKTNTAMFYQTFNFKTTGYQEINIYCYYTINNTLYYDIKTYPLTINLKPNTIKFIVTGTDFDINNESLYITTPCPNKGYSAIGINVGYSPKYNPDGIYWQHLNNGMAEFNLTPGIYNFCLFNGRVNYEDNNFSINYNVIDKYGILNLGNISVPSNINQFYNVRVSLSDIYDKTNPRAYNKTWSMLINSIIGLAFGSIILFVGLQTNNGKIVIAGTLLILLALGYSFNGLMGVLI